MNVAKYDGVFSRGRSQRAAYICRFAKLLLGDPAGTVRGKDALRSYFRKALKTYPDLRFDLKNVMWGINSVVLYYTNQRGTVTGEFMQFDSAGKVVKVVANYGG